MTAEEWQAKVEALEDEVAAARKVLVMFVDGDPVALKAWDEFLDDYGTWPGIDGDYIREEEEANG